jgi:hypothetical protein
MNPAKWVTQGINGVDVHGKGNEKGSVQNSVQFSINRYPRHDFTTAFRDET